MNNSSSRTIPRKCSTESSVLLVIDIQQQLGSAMPDKVLNRVVSTAALLVRSAGLLEVPVLQTQQYPKGLGTTVDEIVDSLPSTVRTFEKTVFSCVAADGFSETLEQSGRQQVIIVGMEAHVCVLQTAIDLVDTGIEVYVVEDAICSRRLENYQNSLERMRQIGANIVSAESVIFEWLVDAKHPQFRTIQKMLR